MTSTYVNKQLQYTDPQHYDQRVQEPTEKYVRSLWQPVLQQALKKYVTPQTIVCDLGCGTLEHTQYMKTAKHIFAVDSNPAMTSYGQAKITDFASQVTVLNENALHTSIPAGTCNLIWSVGLSEYVSLKGLWQEISRLSQAHARVIIQFPNAHSPYNLIMQFFYMVTGHPAKKFRTLHQMQKAAAANGWKLTHHSSIGMVLPVPKFIAAYMHPVWKVADTICSPLQNYVPIGLNVLAIFEK